MFDLGMQELIVIFVVALLVFGPKRLPELSRMLGKGVRELKMAMRGVRDSIDEVEEEVSEEIKQAKTGIEDSVYKDMQTDVNEPEKKKEESGSQKEKKTDDAVKEDSRKE
ncbi:MAG: twin-arginine translocase TatA/TatE family subunit [Nitrospiraceae bacterium]|nr:MAG: twin-arginine translocase TatA/TatE family subunit [bacterium]UCF87220.1 MAG: twin-arginine translocase TatA/TatE family subunit [Nitrospiraceae bacterium]